MLTDRELRDLCKLFKIKLKGIHLKDGLEGIKIQKGFYIYNLDSKKDPVLKTSLGTHWTCSLGNENDIMYFDSYGVVPPNEIAYFMKLKYGKYSYNNYIIQDLYSTSCGVYCLGLALYVKENQSKYPNFLQACNEYINLFEEDAKANDKILRKYLNDAAVKMNVYEKVEPFLLKCIDQKVE